MTDLLQIKIKNHENVLWVGVIEISRVIPGKAEVERGADILPLGSLGLGQADVRQR